MELKDFDDIRTSVLMMVAPTNLHVNVEWLFSVLPILPDSVPSSIKNKSKFQQYLIDRKTPWGTFVSVTYKNQARGRVFKKNSSKTKSQTYFKNGLSLVLFTDKNITMKIPVLGQIQLTGCIKEQQGIDAIQALWMFLQTHPPSEDTYYLNGKNLSCMMVTKMTNKVFNVGFLINRQRLDRFMNLETEFNSLLETSMGYTGVNIKSPSYTINPDAIQVTEVCFLDKNKKHTKKVSYNKYLTRLDTKQIEKEFSGKKITFLVFHSGTIIITGMIPLYMKTFYNRIRELIHMHRDIIEETIPPVV